MRAAHLLERRFLWLRSLGLCDSCRERALPDQLIVVKARGRAGDFSPWCLRTFCPACAAGRSGLRALAVVLRWRVPTARADGAWEADGSVISGPPVIRLPLPPAPAPPPRQVRLFG